MLFVRQDFLYKILQLKKLKIQALPAMIFAIYVGSWSDIHGRKTIIVLSCFGFVISNFIFMVNAYFWHGIKAEYLLFECLQDFTGGVRCFFLGCYCYLSDISDEKTRTRRFNFLDAVYNIGFMGSFETCDMIFHSNFLLIVSNPIFSIRA